MTSVKGKSHLGSLPCLQIVILPRVRGNAKWADSQRSCTSSQCLCVCPVPERSHKWTVPCVLPSAPPSISPSGVGWVSRSRGHSLANSCGSVAVGIVAEFFCFAQCARCRHPSLDRRHNLVVASSAFLWPIASMVVSIGSCVGATIENRRSPIGLPGRPRRIVWLRAHVHTTRQVRGDQ